MKKIIIAVAALGLIGLSSCEVEVRDGHHYHHHPGWEHEHYPNHHEVYDHGYHHDSHGDEIIIKH